MYSSIMLGNILTKKNIIFFTSMMLFFFVYYFYVYNFFTVTYFHEHVHAMQLYIHHHYLSAVIIYSLLFIVAMSFALPGSSLLTMVGGLLFGWWPGFLYAIISATSGALIMFFISRYFIGSAVQQIYTSPLKKFNEDIALHGHYYLLGVRFLGLMPFGLVNLLSGLTLMSAKTYSIITIIGVMPISCMYAFIGHNVHNILSLEEFLYGPYGYATTILIIAKLLLLPLLIKIIRYSKQKISIKAGVFAKNH